MQRANFLKIMTRKTNDIHSWTGFANLWNKKFDQRPKVCIGLLLQILELGCLQIEFIDQRFTPKIIASSNQKVSEIVAIILQSSFKIRIS